MACYQYNIFEPRPRPPKPKPRPTKKSFKIGLKDYISTNVLHDRRVGSLKLTDAIIHAAYILLQKYNKNQLLMKKCKMDLTSAPCLGS